MSKFRLILSVDLRRFLFKEAQLTSTMSISLALRFTRPLYYIISSRVCQEVLKKFFKFFRSPSRSFRFRSWRDFYIISYLKPFVKRFSKKTPIFLFPPFSLFFRQSWFFLFLYFRGFRLGTTRMSIGKSNKKAGRNGRKILPCMLLHKNSCWSLSEFLIYKTVDLRYNSYAVSNSRQVPFVAHCKLRFLRNVKLMTSLRGFGSSVCNFIFLFYIIIQFSKEEKMRLHGLFSQNLWKSGGSCGII